MLAQLNLSSQYQDDNCTGDPGGSHCNWTAAGVGFAGMAHSIDFSGAANSTGSDSITFGSATPGIPEPAIWAMRIPGFGLAGSAARRGKAFRAGA